MSESLISFMRSLLWQIWSFSLPIGFTFGAVIVALLSVPILILVIKKLVG